MLGPHNTEMSITEFESAIDLMRVILSPAGDTSDGGA